MNRVLSITNNSLNRSNANGLLLLDQLSSFKYEEIVTYSIDNALPDKDTGIAHFKTAGNEHLKHFLSKNKLDSINKLMKEKDIARDNLYKYIDSTMKNVISKFAGKSE